MFGRERGISGAKKIYDNRKNVIIKIACFFCGEEFELSVQYGYQIDRAYCLKKGCLEERRKNFRKQAIYRRYSAYLDEVKQKNCLEGVTVIYYVKDGRLLKIDGNADIGKIVKTDDEFVYVQKSLLDSIVPYRRECVQEENDGQMK